MSWYYKTAQSEIGPLSEEDFQNYVVMGAITKSTAVRNDQISDWIPYSQYLAGHLANAGAGADSGPRIAQPYSDSPAYAATLDEYQSSRYDLPPREEFLCQNPEAPVNAPRLWRRLTAWLVDGLICTLAYWAALYMVLLPLFYRRMDLIANASQSGVDPAMNADPRMLIQDALQDAADLVLLANLIYFGLQILYFTLLHGAFGATIGKLLFSIRVQDADGGPVSYMKAFGRYLALQLAYLLLAIAAGVLFAASFCVSIVIGPIALFLGAVAMLVPYFLYLRDMEESNGVESVHDRLCGTQVVMAT
jgi:uncharacterized RDD family membrane protein YckC